MHASHCGACSCLHPLSGPKIRCRSPQVPRPASVSSQVQATQQSTAGMHANLAQHLHASQRCAPG